MNHRFPKVDNVAEIELHWNYRYRTGREAKSLSLVESGYLIVREIKHSGTARQMETLGANRSLPAQGIGGEDEARRSKECGGAGAREAAQSRRPAAGR